MIEPALIVLRLLQYAAASILMGSALFCVYALPAQGPASAAVLRWPKPLLLGAAATLCAATLLGLVAQTATLAGSLSDALTVDALSAVVSQMDLGKAALARALLALAAAVCLLALPVGRAAWLSASLLGAAACASFGWMGHGLATEGAGHLPHLLADIVHALAAAAWIGALVGFVALVAVRRPALGHVQATARALQTFSPLGIGLVGAILASGLINTWFLIGTRVGAALGSSYGQLLALKLALFVAMLALAALHRQRAVPALTARLVDSAAAPERAMGSLRRTLAAEALLGFTVLAVVAAFGTLEPPGAM